MAGSKIKHEMPNSDALDCFPFELIGDMVKKNVLLDKLPIRCCDSCGCVLEFRYTEYVPLLKCSLLGYSCVNQFCAEFGRVFEPPWSDILILSQLGFPLRKFGGKKN
jgi:hypothetical protein